ncbi:MAG TPA: flagellar motor protein [Bdellovibrionales bacterium]|nr:flagellar motor protein [Bdellovibrionales bacterium]
MQLTTIGGLILGVGAILIGNVLEGGSMQSLLQITAFFIVFGGTFGATIVSNRIEDLKLALDYFKLVFASSETTERSRIAGEIIQSAQLARRESILALEQSVGKFRDPFMRSVYRFMIDGVDPEVLRKLFQEEISVSERRKMAAAKVWADAGGFAPTIGIIGAVLGLISVMANISDTSMLGHGIAVAFVATIYGVGSAHFIFIPISNKLKTLIRFRSETEHMILEGALSIINGLNPYLIEQKMRAFTGGVEVKAK